MAAVWASAGGPRAAGPRAAKRTYMALKRGVLVAAEYAVAERGEEGQNVLLRIYNQFLVWCEQSDCWYAQPTSYWTFA